MSRLLSVLCLCLFPSSALAQTSSDDLKTGATLNSRPMFFDYGDDITGELTGGGLVVTQPKISTATALNEMRQAFSQNTLSVNLLRGTGNPVNRIDLVVVGDGYTASGLTKYSNQTNTIINHLFQVSPFKEYQNFFNVYRVDVVSSVSGVSGDPLASVVKATPLGMSFWCQGIERALCTNFQKTEEAAQAAPEADQIIALANSTKYGGAAVPGGNISTAAAGHSLAAEVLVHELAHSMAMLGDEYNYGGPAQHAQVESPFPNISILKSSSMLAASTKWFRWLGVNRGTTFDGLVSTYQGADTSQTGVYRPSNNSKMRNLNRPFNLPSIEALIANFYNKVKPIDSATSSVDPLLSSATIAILPQTPTPRIAWMVDGVEVAAARGSLSFSPGNLSLSNGEHDVSVKVSDETDLVRDPAIRAQRLSDARSWRVMVGSLPPAPAGVQATSSLASQVNISFVRPGGGPWNISGYNLYRSLTASPCQTLLAQLPGGVDTIYADTQVQPGQVYYYSMKSVNASGASRCSNISAGSTNQAPRITLNPRNVSVRSGESASFEAAASGSALRYQWFMVLPGSSEGSLAIQGATQPKLTLARVSVEDNGKSYYLQASNNSGTATSMLAVLTVSP